MVTTHSTRLFTSGEANTLYVTIPARIATDSQFPFDPEHPVRVTIDGDRLLITADHDPGTSS